MTEYVHCASCFFFLAVVVFNETAVRSHFSQTQQTRFFGQHGVDFLN
ncbi:Uncharacterised protein [Vibrio cholerae]|nr:Uncharacterised protein [Vibrio cholerae]CSD06632.1 Uncharacterised protein [Vibrio cholerae]CSI65706.1 Uncharacterised protein [Vibrio cholerae]